MLDRDNKCHQQKSLKVSRKTLLGTVVRKVVFDEEFEQQSNWSKGVSLAFTCSQEALTHSFREACHVRKLKGRSQESLGRPGAAPTPSCGPRCLSCPNMGFRGSPPPPALRPQQCPHGALPPDSLLQGWLLPGWDCPSWDALFAFGWPGAWVVEVRTDSRSPDYAHCGLLAAAPSRGVPPQTPSSSPGDQGGWQGHSCLWEPAPPGPCSPDPPVMGLIT